MIWLELLVVLLFIFPSFKIDGIGYADLVSDYRSNKYYSMVIISMDYPFGKHSLNIT